MYRFKFDSIIIVLANPTTPKTKANFANLWDLQFVNQGKILFLQSLCFFNI